MRWARSTRHRSPTRCGCLPDVGRLKPSSAAILTGSTSMIHERCNRLSTGFRDKLSAGLPNDKRGNVMRWAFLLASIMTISLPAMASPWIEPGDAQVREDVERLKRSEEHTSELQSLMRISYAVFCL